MYLVMGKDKDHNLLFTPTGTGLGIRDKSEAEKIAKDLAFLYPHRVFSIFKLEETYTANISVEKIVSTPV
jgi:hypothetical protein